MSDDYISREAALAALHNRAFDKAARKIKSLPAADVVEARHGRWIAVRLGDMRCSLCGEVYGVCGGLLGDYNYCPYCGADMRKKADHE